MRRANVEFLVRCLALLASSTSEIEFHITVGGGTVCWMRQGLGKVHVLHCMRHVHACMNMRKELKPHQLTLTLGKYHLYAATFLCGEGAWQWAYMP